MKTKTRRLEESTVQLVCFSHFPSTSPTPLFYFITFSFHFLQFSQTAPNFPHLPSRFHLPLSLSPLLITRFPSLHLFLSLFFSSNKTRFFCIFSKPYSSPPSSSWPWAMAILVIEMSLESQIKNLNKTGVATTIMGSNSDPIPSSSFGSYCGCGLTCGGSDFRVGVVVFLHRVGIDKFSV